MQSRVVPWRRERAFWLHFGVDGVEAFAFEHSEVAFVHVIQRCDRIETQLVELLGECVSIRRDARDGEILEPCFDVRQV